jgi:hypothetical protein
VSPRDMSDVSVGVPAAGLDDEGRQAEAQEQLKDAEVEFGHDAPPRRATPDNPEAAEDPSEAGQRVTLGFAASR